MMNELTGKVIWKVARFQSSVGSPVTCVTVPIIPPCPFDTPKSLEAAAAYTWHPQHPQHIIRTQTARGKAAGSDSCQLRLRFQ